MGVELGSAGAYLTGVIQKTAKDNVSPNMWCLDKSFLPFTARDYVNGLCSTGASTHTTLLLTAKRLAT